MKLVDTVAIIGFLNRNDKLHVRCAEHLRSVSGKEYVFVPAVALLEADLVMKLRGYTDSEREVSWHALEGEVPAEKVVPNSASSIRRAVELQKNGVGYFDSLVVALAQETGSTVVTTDKKIGEFAETEW